MSADVQTAAEDFYARRAARGIARKQSRATNGDQRGVAGRRRVLELRTQKRAKPALDSENSLVPRGRAVFEKKRCGISAVFNHKVLRNSRIVRDANAADGE